MPSLQLYSDSSPNGFKITIALEELGCPTHCTTFVSTMASNAARNSCA